jgi:hypothetical protein
MVSLSPVFPERPDRPSTPVGAFFTVSPPNASNLDRRP